MNKILFRNVCVVLMMVIVANGAFAASGEPADWYFVADNNSWKVDATTQFQTTETEGVFILNDYNLAGNTAYKITTADWSSSYGWADGGSISETSIAYPMEKGSAGNGWCALPAGTYDITFDSSASTIEFNLSDTQQEKEEGDIWYITGTFNSWVLDNQFAKSENPEIFVIENLTLPESAVNEGYWDFIITTPGWEVQYICDDNVDELGKEYSFVLRHDNLATYSHLTAGNYQVEWNKGTHTIMFTKAGTTSIDTIDTDYADDSAEYFTIGGARVTSDNLTPGLYLKRSSGKTEKVYIK